MSDDLIDTDELEPVGGIRIEIDHGDLVVGRINFGHGPAAHAFRRVVAGRASRRERHARELSV